MKDDKNQKQDQAPDQTKREPGGPATPPERRGQPPADRNTTLPGQVPVDGPEDVDELDRRNKALRRQETGGGDQHAGGRRSSEG